MKLNLRARFLELASEEEFQQTFPDCQIGALPPFGSQYEMTTLLEESLAGQEQITFEGNTHDQAIRMKCADFQRLENPVVMRFAYQDEA
jgi:Ala-tRNA(Pro) deacylase